MSGRAVVGVRGVPGLEPGGRLAAALESAFEVRFVAMSTADRATVAAVVEAGDAGSGAAAAGAGERPLDGADAAGKGPIPRLVYGSAPGTGDESHSRVVRFAADVAMDRRLRGRALRDGGEDGEAAVPAAGEGAPIVLASAGDDPVWTRRTTEVGPVDFVGTPPIAQLGPSEPLRNRLRAGRFLALLPLVDLVRRVVADGPGAWTPPPLRAAFLLDDPNLHATTYGHLSYDEAVREGDRVGFHLAVAMIPLDGGWASPRAARLFRERPDRLSVLVHGNDHLKRELQRPRTADEADRMTAQALRRISRFERRSGVPVSRVMAAPHGVCSRLAMESLLRTGYEGAAISRPYPWLESPPAERPLAGWGPAEWVVGGFPVIPRYHLQFDAEDRPFRAYLDQPLVLYGHHDDVAAGFSGLVAAAEDVNAIGDASWMSLGEVARTNVATRRRGTRWEVRAFARRVTIDVPDDVSELLVSYDSAEGEAVEEAVRIGSANKTRGAAGAPRIAATSLSPELDADGRRAARFSVESPGRLEIVRAHPDSLDPETVPSPPRRLWPLARRVLTEGRDRVRPLLKR